MSVSKKQVSVSKVSNTMKVAQLKALGFTEEQIKIAMSVMIPSGISGRADLKTVVTRGEFKGKQTLSMIKGSESFINKPFTFGKEKAKMIVEQFEAIKQFATEL